MHPEVYVAQTTAAHINHFYKAVMEANDYPGPAVINVYTTCQPEHGVPDCNSTHQAKLAVEVAGVSDFYIYDPRKGEKISRAVEPGRKSGAKRGLVDAAESAKSRSRLSILHAARDASPNSSIARENHQKRCCKLNKIVCKTGGCCKSSREYVDRIEGGGNMARGEVFLVPVDFSRGSEKALDYALKMARQQGAKVVSLHVVPADVIYPQTGASFDLYGLMERDARRNFQKLVKRKRLDPKEFQLWCLRMARISRQSSRARRKKLARR